MTTPGAQHNRAQDDGRQNITGSGDVNDRSDNRQYTFVTLPAEPPRPPRPRLLRPVPLVAGGVLLAAVAFALGGQKWFGGPAGVADTAQSDPMATARGGSATPRSSRPAGPSGTATPTERPSTAEPSGQSASAERKRPAPPSTSDSPPLQASPISTYPHTDVYCGDWRGSGAGGLDISPCVQAVDHRGTAQFGVRVRNTRSVQAVVSVDVAWLRKGMLRECETGSALRQRIVINPDTIWYSPLSCSADAVEGYAVQAAAWAVAEPEADVTLRTRGDRQLSPTAQIKADGAVSRQQS
ncbi:membrane protein [Streptomyces noursei ATCC 11455]|uniref:hypothetical protein n=1 Tax=Streptomyces noursei TaxID=1971 RepID=UPI00081D1628|nr:membrane protein [Streptomyces noursei ATCC 11455]